MRLEPMTCLDVAWVCEECGNPLTLPDSSAARVDVHEFVTSCGCDATEKTIRPLVPPVAEWFKVTNT